MKTAIVTGAGRGIGFAVAKALLENGFNTVLCARNKNENIDKLKEIYKEKMCFIYANISNEDDRRFITETTLKTFGTPHILVNNAGVAPRERKDMLEITEDDFDFVMNINLKGTYFLTQQISKLMIEKGEGYIVNVGSISANTVSVNRAEYCISKAGVRMLKELFATRLAENNIGVFEISPGVIDTDMISTVKAKYDNLAESGTIPAKRLGTPEDVAKIVLSIALGSLDYCTGTVLHCDGALHIPIL